MSWPIVTVSGIDYYDFQGQVLIPVTPDPAGETAHIILRPQGGVAGAGVPAIEQGDDGVPPTLSTISLTELAWDDATPASAAWTLSSPGPPPVYTLAMSLHGGSPGANGDTVLDPADFTSPLYKKILQVDAAVTGFELVYPKVGDRFYPTTINNASTGNAGYTLAVVSVAGQNFDWRPEVKGQCVITGTGADVRTDLVARLNGETGGNIVGRGFGTVGVNAAGIPTVLSSGPPAGSATDFDRVAQGAAATIHLRVERQTGADTFSTSNTTTWFGVRVCPIP